MTTKELVGYNLKLLRNHMGLTAADLSSILGLGAVHIYNIESGKTSLSYNHIDTLCKTFEIDPAYFLTDHEKLQHFPGIIPRELHGIITRVKELHPEMRTFVATFVKFLLYLKENDMDVSVHASQLTSNIEPAKKKRSGRKSKQQNEKES